ncbi:hypothetical protein BDZ45DRAFT_731457 [Acephala macrosclerotiorum]|nr:hypothetical protein BDZ45DRAFT_731457 [Acephala macrosclerotiorum]
MTFTCSFQPSLPAKEMLEFINDPITIKLHQKISKLRGDGAASDAIKEAERSYKNHYRWLKKQELTRWKAKWLDQRYQQIIKTRGKISCNGSSTDRAQALFRAMPERVRLANMIQSTEPRTREQRLLAVQDLHSLCTRNLDVMYLPGEEPVHGACPVCLRPLPKGKRDRAGHIHNCRRKEFTAKAGAGSGKVSYCFFCFRWFSGATDWEEHCRDHLASTTPKWCAVRKYRNTMISPGYCPFHLSDEELPAAQRLQHWTRNCSLMTHVDNHISQVDSWPITASCCEIEVESEIDLRYHLMDVHGLSRAEMKIVGRKRTAEEENNIVDPPPPANREDRTGDARPRKRRQVGKAGLTFIEWNPAANSGSYHPPSTQDTVHSDEPPRCNQPAPSRDYPELVDGREGAPDGDLLVDLWPQVDDEFDNFARQDFMDDAVGLNYVSGAEGGNSVSTPLTSTCSDFEYLLDPELRNLSGVVSQASSEFSKEIETSQDDGKDQLDPHLGAILNNDPDCPSPEVLGSHGSLIVRDSAGHEANAQRLDGDDVRREHQLGMHRGLLASSEQSLVLGESNIRPVEASRPRLRGRLREPKNPQHQPTFSKAHKGKDAEAEWGRRRYPRIVWRTLPSRFQKFSPALRVILNGDAPSFSSSELEFAISKKPHCMATLTAGYFGPRGQKIMADHISDRFGSELRQREVVDGILKTVGVLGYINAVLVPELTVMLITEDMDVRDEEARAIFRESTGLGETLCGIV